MGTSLNGLTPQDTYEGLIKFGDNTALTSTLKAISDGAGNDTMLELSTTALQIGGNTGMYWDDTNKRLGVGTNSPSALLNVQNSSNGALLARFKDNISSPTYLDIKADVTLTDYTALYFGSSRRIMSKQSGALFLTCDNGVSFVDGLTSVTQITPTQVNIGSISGARLGIKGSGSTSATTSLLVQNSSGTEAFRVYDDRTAVFSTSVTANRFIGQIVEANYINTVGNGYSALQTNPSNGNVRFYQSVSIGTTSDPISRLQVVGSGSTSATTSLLVQNSSGVASLQILDDGSVFNNGGGAVTSNTAFGNSALIANTTGSGNTANGVNALATNTTGGDNTANGGNALALNVNGTNNTAIGVQALFANNGANNTAIGRGALRNNTASNNAAVGYEAAFANTSGTGITAIGYQALRANTGANNTAVGFQAGDNITTGAGNICIGSGAQPANATDSNQFVVGSATVNAGTITTETITPDTTWMVRINGVNYKIPLLAI